MAPISNRNKDLIATFERALLRGDSNTLSSFHPDAPAVAAGNFNVFLSQCADLDGKHLQPAPAVSITAECIQSAAQLTMHSRTLANALTDAAHGHLQSLYNAYLAGVALLQAFVRENWAGPISLHSVSPHAEAAAFFLSVDGEDVSRPAKCLHWLRAARFILVEHVQQFVSSGASLVPWWACRVLLAHQSMLSNPTPTIQDALFYMYARFLGAHVAESRYRSAPHADSNQVPADGDDTDESDLLPFPVLEGTDTIADEEEDFVEVLQEREQDDRQLLALAYVELALAQKMFYESEQALSSLRKASRLDRIAFRVTGKMGVRTKHQTKPTAQLVARAFEIQLPDDSEMPEMQRAAFFVKLPCNVHPFREQETLSAREWPTDSSLPLPKNIPVNDEDALGFVKLINNSQTDESTVEGVQDSEDDTEEWSDLETLGTELFELTPLQQALALCNASVIRARNASHALTKEEMAPFVDFVLKGPKSRYGTSSVLQLRALMLRVTFERERGRLLERCMTQMEEVGRFVDDHLETLDIDLKYSAAAERNMFVFGSSLPPRWELKKELAISFGKIGLVKSAMEIFEELEYWDELVDCHRLIGNLGAAEHMVRKELERLDQAVLDEGVSQDDTYDLLKDTDSTRAVQKRAARRPRLLCVLGDVTRDPEYYETAWNESGHRYARAKRSLGRTCVESQKWEAAMGHFRMALDINSLFPDTWFTYGCAAMQVGDMQVAANAFTRVIQQTPDNGEAWNNLGRALHELGKKKEALTAFVEAGKSRRESWRVWNNVLLLATELRSCNYMLQAMDRLIDIRGKDGVCAPPLGVVVAEVIRMSSSSDAEDKALVGPVSRRLLKVLARSTSLVSSNPSIWAAYAELHELLPSREDKQRAFECRLKQVRSLIANGQWKTEVPALRHMALACDALAKDALGTRNALNIRAASIQTKSIIEQTKQDYQENDGFQRLLQVQDGLQNASESDDL